LRKNLSSSDSLKKNSLQPVIPYSSRMPFMGMWSQLGRLSNS
jgi:hypothetical protein